MITKETAGAISAYLHTAEERGILQACDVYVESDICMCALAALYHVVTGDVPWHWNSSFDHEIAQELFESTGINFLEEQENGVSLMSQMIHLGDNVGLSFCEIARALY